MTEAQLAANRNNALKSTGPRNTAGKARSSRNALKHGARSAAPILPGLESPEAWEKHRDGFFKSIAPVGYLEEVLADRLAVDSWRLLRVVRYETEVAAAAVAVAEVDLEVNRAEVDSGKPSDPAEAWAEAKATYLVGRVLKDLPNMADKDVLDKEVAIGTLKALYEHLPEGCGNLSVPGIPDENDAFFDFEDWRAGLLRKAIEVYAATAGMTPDDLRLKCMFTERKKHNAALERRSHLQKRQRCWKLLLERENRRRVLLEPDVLEKVTRYESNLERSFFRVLHEIQRLQAARSSAVVPPPAALDVDLTIHPETPVEAADNAREDEITKRTPISPEK